MKVLFNTIYYVLVAGMVTVALLLLATLAPIPGNFKVKIVKSGSMEPAIMTGSIVVDEAASAYNVGDVITFGPESATQIPTTHRIVAISAAPDPVYTTKGDANDAADVSVTHLSDIHGKVILTVPCLGYILSFARTTLGFALIVGVPALAVIIEEVGNIIREIQALRRKKKATTTTTTTTLHANPKYNIKRIVN
jgi:signal peptidase